MKTLSRTAIKPRDRFDLLKEYPNEFLRIPVIVRLDNGYEGATIVEASCGDFSSLSDLLPILHQTKGK